VVYHGDLYFSIGRALLRYTSGSVLGTVAPDLTRDEAQDSRYTYRAAVATPGALYVLVDTGLAGAPRLLAYADGRWHPLADFWPGDFLGGACLEPGWYGSHARLWCGLGLAVGYLELPQGTARRWLYRGVRFARWGHVDLSWFDGGIFTVRKDWYSVELVLRDASVATPVSVYYRAAPDAEFVLLGEATTNGVNTLPFPPGTCDFKLQLRLAITRHTWVSPDTVTPRIEAVVLKYLERPDEINAFTRTYELADRLVLRSGLEVRETLAEQWLALRDLRASREPLTFTTWYGTHHHVQIVSYSTAEMPRVGNPAGERGSMVVVVQLQELEALPQYSSTSA
jgi:hypothetical protein